jgi:glycerol-3-phosphate dehydrogenase (NAD(P)+)
LTPSADDECLREADLVCFVVPSQTLAATAQRLAPSIRRSATLLSACKGIELDSGRRMSEVLRDAIPGRPVAALSGPNLSREVASGLPGTTVVASADASLEALREAFHALTFRVYTSDDIVGVELGGALKNIVAIAAGMVDALGYGDNAKAAVMTRGLAEMTRLGVAAGADPLTFQGLAGVGDLIATSYSPLSRNRRLGEQLARGASLDQALAEIGETAEGAATTPAALRLARRLGVEMPIAEGLHAILYEGVSPQAAVNALLERDPKPEVIASRTPRG